MKKSYWISLDRMVAQYGFSQDGFSKRNTLEKWYARHPETEGGVSTHLCFSYKSKFQVLSVEIGWRHDATHAFCVEALRCDWQAGYDWLNGVGVLSLPCLNPFNLLHCMPWRLGGMPISEEERLYKREEGALSQLLAEKQWHIVDPVSLLARYVGDEKPFNWFHPNAAIRLAEVAGLSKNLGISAERFEYCAEHHYKWIEAHLFQRGSGPHWINALRQRLRADGTAQNRGQTGII